MRVSEVRENSAASPAAVRPSVPGGLASVPDRLEVPPRREENPPSMFKKFLFDPLVDCFRWLLRGVFLFTEALWSFAFAEETQASVEPESKPFSAEKKLLERLQSTPTKEELFAHFERIVNETERREIYRLLGAAYPKKLSWKEYVWSRSSLQNEAIGRQLVRANPQRIKEHLEATLARMP